MADCITSCGVYSAATPYKARTASCKTTGGVASAASSVTWAGNTGARRTNDWLPRADEVWFDVKTGRPTRRFFQFIREVAEVRLGGIEGKTVPQVHSDVVQTQATTSATVSYATQLGQYTQGVAATAAATLQVLKDNAEPSAETVPPPPEEAPIYRPPGKPGSEEL